MKVKILISAIILVLAACTEEDQQAGNLHWKKLGLDGKTVNEMQIDGDKLYVATTSGLFVKDIDASSGFQSLGFGNKNVEAIEVFDSGVIVVSLVDKSGAEAPALHKSNDGGTSWSLLESDFGGEVNEPVFDLEAHPGRDDVLFAAGYTVVAKSETQGTTWQPLYGDWGGFSTGVSVVELNLTDPAELWAGGQGAIENGFLMRSHDGDTWDVWNDLVENPTVVKEIVFSDKSPDEVFVGFEGALLKTTDSGDSWETLIDSEENRFYFGIALRPEDPARVYAGGWLKTPDPQPMMLFLSDNGGQSWSEVRFPGESYGGILDMQIRKSGNEDVLYVGLDKGGVYEITVGF